MAAVVVGYLLYDVWGLAGGVAGILAALAAGQAGGGVWMRSLAATLPPLVAVGPSALLVAAVLALVLAAQRLQDPRVYLFGGLALFVPLPGAAYVATAAGALLVATGRRGWIAAGAGLCLGPWLLASTTPIPGVLALGFGLLARALATHPANASVARGLVALGALLLCAPAIAAVALAAMGALPNGFAVLVGAAIGGILVGAILLAAHAGLAALHLSDVPALPVWTTLTWLPAGGILLLDPRAGDMGPPLAALLPLLGLTTVSVAVGARWLKRSLSRQEVAGKA
jgi:hypothetical protein